MPTAAEMEIVEIDGREIKLRWKSPRFGEWLAWCYVPSDSQAHNEGSGFEARAGTAEAAKAACLDLVRTHVAKQSGSG